MSKKKILEFAIYCCHEKFGGRNGAAMFVKLEERIKEFMESIEGANISYQLYNKDQNSAFWQS